VSGGGVREDSGERSRRHARGASRSVDGRPAHHPRRRPIPEYGRHLDRTFGEIGLAGHWIKILLHHLFLYKARLRPGWSLIPE